MRMQVRLPISNRALATTYLLLLVLPPHSLPPYPDYRNKDVARVVSYVARRVPLSLVLKDIELSNRSSNLQQQQQQQQQQ